jgi:preprotein translocase subunit SecB
MSEQQGKGEGADEGRPATTFSIQRIYLKDASFESPESPRSFRTEWKPKINLELNSKHIKLEAKLWEVVLNLTITAKTEQDEVLYLVEVQQAGIFHIDGLDAEILSHTLGGFCPGVLFPYAREVVDSLVVKGSYPALMLAPVNFDAIYEQSKLEQAKQQNQIQ